MAGFSKVQPAIVENDAVSSAQTEVGLLSALPPYCVEGGPPAVVPFVPDVKRPKRSRPLRAVMPFDTLSRTLCDLPRNCPAEEGMFSRTLPADRFLKRSKALMPGSLAGVMLSRKFLIGAVMPNSLTGTGALCATVPPTGGDALTAPQADNTTCGEPKTPHTRTAIITNTDIFCIPFSLLSLVFTLVLLTFPLSSSEESYPYDMN